MSKKVMKIITNRDHIVGDINNLRHKYCCYLNRNIENGIITMSYYTYMQLLMEASRLNVFVDIKPVTDDFGTIFGLKINIDRYLPNHVIEIKEDNMNVDRDSICMGIDRPSWLRKPSIVCTLPKKYILNQDACILFWNDGDKTIVKRSKDDIQDPVKGFLWAYFLKYSGLSRTKANKYLKEIDEAYQSVLNKED